MKEELKGQIVVDVYEDSFEVATTGNLDLATVFLVAAGIQNYLEDVAETLDTPPTTMLQ